MRLHEQATQLQAVSQTAKEGQTSQKIHPVTREKGKGTDKTQCWRCGRTGHEDEKCYFRRKQCRKCNKYGHIAKICKSETEGGHGEECAPHRGQRRANRSEIVRCRFRYGQEHRRHSKHMYKIDIQCPQLTPPPGPAT